jgi:acetyl esterase
MATAPHRNSTRSDGLRPEITQFLEEMSIAGKPYPSLMTIPVEEAREIAERVRKPFTANGPTMAATREQQIDLPSGPLKIRIYSPETDKPLPCLFYIHGGGWVLFSLDTHDRLMREYAAGANMHVIGIDYSLAPENKFPKQINEITETVKWCLDHATALGINPEKAFIGGDSAGANLSVATCLTLKDHNLLHNIRGMLLNYGVFDGRCHTESYKNFGQGEYLLSEEEMHWFWRAYLNDPIEVTLPLVSPVFADVRDLPPAFMVITDHDPLHDENVHMKNHFEAAGVAVTAKTYQGTTHSFLEAIYLGGVANEAIKDTTTWLKTLGHES